jgi:4a-hydroxytetrahydrobiopterin dehydratase
MTTQTAEPLAARKCRPCEGGAARLSPAEAHTELELLSGWRISQDGRQLEKEWLVKDFTAGIDFINRVAAVAEAEDHHPELHLTGYRHVWIELWTHAAGGLTENDFIVAAKIDELPVTLKE